MSKSALGVEGIGNAVTAKSAISPYLKGEE